MQLFYAPDVHTELVSLPEEESRHCARVLRKRVGDVIQLTNGAGGLWNAEIVRIEQRECLVKLLDELEPEASRSFHLTIGISPAKSNDRFEWFLEKATEIGVDRVVPLETKRTERFRLKHDRLNKVLLSAMKQSGRALLPILEQAQTLQQFLKKDQPVDQKFMATCFGKDRKPLKELYEKGRNIVILIGPEGDFTPEEVESAIAAGYKTVSLGNTRLRLETAGIVVCHTLNLMNE